MSLLSKCKRGNFEGVKAALSEGQLDKMTCAEKLNCVKAVNKPHEKNQAVLKTLLGHLNMGRFKGIMEQIAWRVRCEQTTTKLAAVQCLKNSQASYRFTMSVRNRSILLSNQSVFQSCCASWKL